MEILSPQLTWIGGRCYRVNPTNEAGKNADVSAKTEVELPVLEQYVEKDLYDEPEGEEDSYNIVLLESTKRFKSTFHVPKPFYGMLIGAKGTTRKRIESETKTMLKVPQQGADGDVELTGSTRGAVAAARRRIDVLVIEARSKQNFTHFVCVPVVQPTIKERFAQFKAAIVSGAPIFGLEETMFQNVDKLHLTVGMLALMDNVDRQLAGQLLLDCQQTIVKPILQTHGSLDFRVAGVDCMNNDPSDVHVLYGRVVCEPLQLIAEQIVDVFVRNGLMRRQHEQVKLHVTLINSRFRNNSGNLYDEDEAAAKTGAGGGGQPAKAITSRRQGFDARQILEQFGSFDFGKQPLTEIHLSRRFTTSCETGFYDASVVLKVF